jgi:hypothetical protein
MFRKLSVAGLAVLLGGLLAHTVTANAANPLEAGAGTVTVNGTDFNAIRKAATLDCSLDLRLSGFGGSSTRVRVIAFEPSFDRKVQLRTLVDRNVTLSNGSGSTSIRPGASGVPTDATGRIRVKLLVGSGASGQKGYVYVWLRGC